MLVKKTNLPRLEPEWYRGRAWVFWTFTIEQRKTGWLNNDFSQGFREAALHAQAREVIACPVYVLMPDHMHLIWIGAGEQSDQLLAARVLRRALNGLLLPERLQKQPHDHVLREKERARGAFAATWEYIIRNPERAGCVKNWQDYPYLGAMVPGYPGLDPRIDGFSDQFWRAYTAFSLRFSS